MKTNFKINIYIFSFMMFCHPLLCPSFSFAEQTTGTSIGKANIMTTNNLGELTYDRGCIIRGPRDKRQMAIQITGDEFSEGGTKILDTFKERGIHATFFFTGNFYRNPEFQSIIKRAIREGHYVGPHGDKHLLYATWDNPPKLIVKKEDFAKDILDNLKTIEIYGIKRKDITIWNPAYQHYTAEVTAWGKELGLQAVNYTPGARTMADYMLDSDPRFLSARDMVNTVYEYEKKDPNGLNGFIMHMHIGAGPGRTKDHLYDLLPELIDTLTEKGYKFVRVDKLLNLRQD